MEFTGFRELVLNGIKGQYPEIEITKVESFSNSEIYRLQGKENAREVIVKLTEKYRQCEMGVSSAQDVINDSLLWFKGDEERREAFLDKGWVLRHSRLKVFNRNKYRYLLAEVANKRIKGTEFNLLCTLTNESFHESNMLITYEMLDGLNLAEEELFEVAVKNELSKDVMVGLSGDGYVSMDDRTQAFIPERLDKLFSKSVFILPCKQLKIKFAEESEEEVLKDFQEQVRMEAQESDEAGNEAGKKAGWLEEETGVGTQVIRYENGKFTSLGGKHMECSRSAYVKSMILQYMQGKERVNRKDIVEAIKASEMGKDISDGVIAGGFKMLTLSGDIIPVERGVYARGNTEDKGGKNLERIAKLCNRFKAELNRACTFNILSLSDSEKGIYAQFSDCLDHLLESVEQSVLTINMLMEESLDGMAGDFEGIESLEESLEEIEEEEEEQYIENDDDYWTWDDIEDDKERLRKKIEILSEVPYLGSFPDEEEMERQEREQEEAAQQEKTEDVEKGEQPEKEGTGKVEKKRNRGKSRK